MNYPNQSGDHNPSADGESKEQCKREDALATVQPDSTPPPMAAGKIGLRVTHLPFDWNKVSISDINEVISPWLDQTTLLRADKGQLRGCYYVNPTVEIYSPVPSSAFLRLANEHSDRWCQRLAEVFGLGELNGEWHTVPLRDRGLTSGGVMIIDAEIVYCCEWDKVPVRDERSVLCDAKC
jgi:hypothetical protein